MKYKFIIFGIGLSLAALPVAQAQLTWADDVIISGNLDVGTTNDKGNLTITGQTGNTAAPGIRVTGDGGVVFDGTLGVGQIPALGSGVARFMWYPKKAALRAGRSGANWDDAKIGVDSVAFGNSIASGYTSFAVVGSEAHGSDSLAMSGGIALFDNSTAIDRGLAGGYFTVAIAGGMALNDECVAIQFGTALALYSTAMNGGCTYGIGSFALGEGTTADSYASIAIGWYNIPNLSQEMGQWKESDSLFVVGNGHRGNESNNWEPIYRNALTMLKNGKTTLTQLKYDHQAPLGGDFDDSNQDDRTVLEVEGHASFKGKVRMPRQGDIGMGEFGNPE